MWSNQHCDGDVKLFAKLMKQQYEHFCNTSHINCTHVPDYKPKAWKWVENEKDRAALWIEFQVP